MSIGWGADKLLLDDEDGQTMTNTLANLELAAASLSVLLLMADEPRLMPVALMLMALPWLSRLWRLGRLTVRTPLDWPLRLFVLTASVGVWAAYDRTLAWPLFWLIVGGVGLYYALANGQRPTTECATGQGARDRWATADRQWRFCLGLCIFGAVLSVYFVTRRDWVSEWVEFAAIAKVGAWLAARIPQVPGPDLHTNLLGGTLAVIWPINLALLRAATRTPQATRSARGAEQDPAQTSAQSGQPRGSSTLRQRARLFAASTTFLILSIALIMSGSRGTWLALGVAGGLALLGQVWRRSTGRTGPSRAWLVAAVAAVVIAAALVWLAWFSAESRLNGSQVAGWVRGVLAVRNAKYRLDIYRRALALVSDYPFTGSGLGSFRMVYSTYALLIHVGLTSHAHNLYLQLAAQQGVFGLLAFLWMVAAAFWQVPRYGSQGSSGRPQTGHTYRPSAVGEAALWSVAVVLLHGIIDAPLVTGRMLPVLFVPFGLAVSDGLPGDHAHRRVSNTTFAVSTRRQLARLLLAAGFLVAAVIWHRPLLSLVLSNLGTVHQTRTELSLYEWPEWPIQDAVRREVDLSRPVAELQRALVYNPGNGPANRRLGMIELSLGEYGSALGHLTRAYAVEQGNETTRQLLGEALIANGQLDAGRELWSTVENERGQLGLRVWWYGQVGDLERAEWMLATEMRSPLCGYLSGLPDGELTPEVDGPNLQEARLRDTCQ